jgi:hypothetical protein
MKGSSCGISPVSVENPPVGFGAPRFDIEPEYAEALEVIEVVGMLVRAFVAQEDCHQACADRRARRVSFVS